MGRSGWKEGADALDTRTGAERSACRRARRRVYKRLTLLGVVGLGVAGCSGDGPGDGVSARRAALTVSPPVGAFVVLASSGASFDDRSVVSGGHVGVGASGTATLNTFTAGADSLTAIGAELIAPRVVLRERAIAGNVDATQISAPLATTGTRSPFIAPPAPPLPTAANPGTAGVTVASGQTASLAAGRYAAVSVSGTLNLSGGLYEFQSLRIDNGAAVIARGAATVRIATGLTALDRARFVPQSPLGAGDLRLEASGAVNAANDGIVFGNDGQLTALAVARRAFRAGDRLIATGAIGAGTVIVGHDARVTYARGFGCNTDASCDDGNACVVDTCVDLACQHAPAITPGCGTVVLAATNEQPKLGTGPFSSFSASITFVGRVKAPVGLASVTVSVNGGAPITPSLDAGGNFSLPVTLNHSAASAAVTNTVVITAVDVFGTVSTLPVRIDGLAVAVPDEMVVLFNADGSDASRMGLLAPVGGVLRRRLTANTWLVSVPGGTVAQAIAALAPPTAEIRSAFPNVLLQPTMTPNDSLIESQREYLQSMRAFDAWNVETGSSDVVVAVVDSGVDLPTLASGNPCAGTAKRNNIFLNEAECCASGVCTTQERLNCMPGANNNKDSNSGLGSFTDCPRADMNHDGCAGVCGVDDDGDGLADMADPEVKRLYSNGLDDDGDGHIDEQAIVNNVLVPCENVQPGDLIGAPANGDCDGAANDDDENGYPDDCRGWNFGRIILPECTAAQDATNGNGTCLHKASIDHPNQTIDTRGFHAEGFEHGAWVARIIGEPGNDCSGYSGLAFNVRILPLENSRYFPGTGGGAGTIAPDLAATIEAYTYAGKMGAHIINSSFVMSPDNEFAARFPQLANSYGRQLATDLIDLTGSDRALHVMGAGNSGVDVTNWVLFPPQANIPNKLVVGASDPADDSIAKFSATTGSNFSATLVDLAAPGLRSMQGFAGTSAAAPEVSGAAALLMSHFPTLRGQPELAAAMLRSSARVVAPWSGASKTGGIVNIAAALGTPVPSLLFRDASATALPSPSNLPSTELDLIDVDADGHVDMMFEASCSRTNVVGQPHLRVNTNGVLTDRTVELLPAFQGSYCDAVDGDLDGDGRSDIVLAAFLPQGTSDQLQNKVLMSSGGGFVLSDRFPAAAQQTRAAAVCDFDGDGDLDVFFANVGSESGKAGAVLLRNDGSGNFTDVSATTLPNPLAAQSPHKALCVDLDKPAANQCQGLPADVCALCANPRLSVKGLVAAGRVNATQNATCLAVRGTVQPELVIASAEGSGTVLLRRNAGGAFDDRSCDLGLPRLDGTPMPSCQVGVSVPGRQDHDVQAADFDGDGALDLIFVSRRGGPNTLVFNNGSGVFTNVTSSHWTLALNDARDVKVADVNLDGAPDVLVTRGDPNLMNPGPNVLYLNNGSGFLTEFAASGLGSHADLTSAAGFADLDGDGDPDLVLVRYGEADRVLLNNTHP